MSCALRLRLRRLVKGENTTSRQEASLTEQRNALRVKIANWQRIQSIYMPGLLSIQSDDSLTIPPSPDSHQPENMLLWLPSSLPPSRRKAACAPMLPDYEEKLRTAQCYDALEKLRHVLRVKTRMVQFKNKNIRGQAGGTRSRTVINRVQERAAYVSQHYRIVRAAKFQLSGPGDWEQNLRALKDSDVRSYQDPDRIKRGPGRRGVLEDNQMDIIEERQGAGITLIPESRRKRDGTGETYKTLSWIWLVERPDGALEGEGSNKGDSDGILRAEWCKSRARVNRSVEEVKTVREEMRRCIESLNWEARWWTERHASRVVVDHALTEGLVSYAIKQTTIKRELIASAQSLFKTPLEDVEDDRLKSSSTKGNNSEDSEDSEDSDDGGDGELHDDDAMEDE